MVYALAGIPLMFIYMANIGSILATSFKYTYSKMCRCEGEPEDLPREATLPAREEVREVVEVPSRRVSYSATSSLAPPSLPHLRAPAHLEGSCTPLPPYTPQLPRSPPALEEQATATQDTVHFKLVEDLKLVTIPVTTCLLVFFGYILCGAVIFSAWEGWGLLDGAYFCFTSLMTIGFGDFVPGNSYIYEVSDSVTEQEANAKLVLGTVYLLLGMAVMSMCINLVQEEIVAQVRLLARSLGLILGDIYKGAKSKTTFGPP